MSDTRDTSDRGAMSTVTGSSEALATAEEIAVAQGWFEPCTTHRGDFVDGPCAHCGWLAADHTAGLAEVITVTPSAVPRPLRRAS